jgi:hypothetical protein
MDVARPRLQTRGMHEEFDMTLIGQSDGIRACPQRDSPDLYVPTLGMPRSGKRFNEWHPR